MLAKRVEEWDDYTESGYELPEINPTAKPDLKLVPHSRVMLDKPLRTRCQTLFAIFTVLAMLVTIRSGICASRGYALVATQQEAQNLELENERLRIEIAQLKAPHRIKEIAETDLQMQVPTASYFAR